jgi:hypothetical protein
MPFTIENELQPTRREVGWGVYELRDLGAYLALSGAREDAQKALP